MFIWFPYNRYGKYIVHKSDFQGKTEPKCVVSNHSPTTRPYQKK